MNARRGIRLWLTWVHVVRRAIGPAKCCGTAARAWRLACRACTRTWHATPTGAAAAVHVCGLARRAEATLRARPSLACAGNSNRGHTVKAVCESFELAKDAGYKVVAHMMPDLPNVGLERDIEQFIVRRPARASQTLQSLR